MIFICYFGSIWNEGIRTGLTKKITPNKLVAFIYFYWLFIAEKAKICGISMSISQFLDAMFLIQSVPIPPIYILLIVNRLLDTDLQLFSWKVLHHSFFQNSLTASKTKKVLHHQQFVFSLKIQDTDLQLFFLKRWVKKF